MKVVGISKLVFLAKKFHSQGKKWHFHMLAPSCVFNTSKGKHSFILENVENGQVFVSYSRKRYLKHGKELVKLIYGRHILDSKRNKTKMTNRKIKIILKRANKLNKLNIVWEHHLLFPKCIFNKHKGKWCIIFEEPKNNKMIESIHKHEPLDNLRAIENLYYQQKK